MRRIMFKSKIHRATVTDTFLDYEGSLTIDPDLLDAADILPHEQIHVWDITNGARLITYALPGERGSGTIQVNGGGAHLINKGDLIIIATFTELRGKAARKHEPLVVLVDERNQPITAAPPSQTPLTTPMGTAPKRSRKSKAV